MDLGDGFHFSWVLMIATLALIGYASTVGLPEGKKDPYRVEMFIRFGSSVGCCVGALTTIYALVTCPYRLTDLVSLPAALLLIPLGCGLGVYTIGASFRRTRRLVNLLNQGERIDNVARHFTMLIYFVVALITGTLSATNFYSLYWC